MVMPAAVQVQAMQVAAFKTVVVAGQAIVRRLPRVGRAQVAAVISNPRKTHTAIVAARAAACDLAAAFPTAAHTVVLRIARHALRVNGEIAAAAGYRHRPRSTGTARACAHLNLAFIALFWYGGGNLVVQHIDDAANRACAIDQRRRPAQYLDLPRQHGLGGH